MRKLRTNKNKDEKIHIVITVETAEQLLKISRYSSQTYDEIINDLLKIAEKKVINY